MKLGLPATLTLILAILKLAGVIDWSWWIVFLPILFMPIIILLTIFGLAGVMSLLMMKTKSRGAGFSENMVEDEDSEIDENGFKIVKEVEDEK